MSTYFHTTDLSFTDLIDNKKTLSKNKISIKEDKNSYFLFDETSKQRIWIDMESTEDTEIVFSRFGNNFEGCGNILRVIMDLFPDCGLVDEYTLMERYLSSKDYLENPLL